MRTFAYQGFDAAGRRARGFVEADSLKDARERLAARGVLAEDCAPVDPAHAAGRRTRHGWHRAETRAMAYRELSAMLRAGVPLVRAMELLMDAPEHADGRAALAHVRDRLREGDTPAAALRAAGGATALELAAVEAGQRAGALDQSLERLAGHMESSRGAMERARTALIYPAFVAGFGILVAAGLLGFLLPAFSRIWTEARVPLPGPTRAMMAVGRATVWLVPAALALGAAAVVFLRRRWRRSAAFRAGVEQRLARLPIAGPAWNALIAARFARTLHLLLEGGVPLVEAMDMAGAACGSAWVEREMGPASASVRQGHPFAAALRRIPPLGQGLGGWVDAGEAAGDIARMLEPAADRLQQMWDRRLQRAVSLLEPIVILLLGALVLWIALAVILPILSLNRSLG
jgi:general secretion pathway protein F